MTFKKSHSERGHKDIHNIFPEEIYYIIFT